jgi:hypothetical protein
MSDIVEQAPLTPAEKARAKFLADFANLMGNGDEIKPATFRRWLWHLIEDAGWCYTHAKGAGTKDVHALYFALGAREIGINLLQTAMAVADESYRRMLLEAINLKTQREVQADFPPAAE